MCAGPAGPFAAIAVEEAPPGGLAQPQLGNTRSTGRPSCRIGPDAKLRDRDGDVLSKLGISADGGLLVRPDGFVAWRAASRHMLTSSPETTLEQVLARILSRPMPAGTTST